MSKREREEKKKEKELHIGCSSSRLSLYAAEQVRRGHGRSTHLRQIVVLICPHVLTSLIVQEGVSGVQSALWLLLLEKNRYNFSIKVRRPPRSSVL